MATDKTVWFGTEGRMTWIKAPAANMGRSRVGWSAPAQLLNGGALQLSSAYSHLTYDLSWSTLDSRQRNLIMGYAAGLYGSGPLYFVDPSAKNLLPMSWAAPMLGALDALPLIKDRRPTLSDVTGTYMPGLPAQYATYAMGGAWVPNKITVAIPRAHNLAVYGFGSATGDSTVRVNYKTSGGVATSTALPLFAASTLSVQSGVPVITNYNGENDTVTFELNGTGTLTLAGLQAVVYDPNDGFEVQTNYHMGEGNSGLRFSAIPTELVYSSRLDLTGLTAQLIETGEWESA